MENFFELIYDRAAETNSLGFATDRGYRRADKNLEALLSQLHLDAKTETDLMNAVYDFSYHSGVCCLAYGFRLAAQVIRPAEPVYPARA